MQDIDLSRGHNLDRSDPAYLTPERRVLNQSGFDVTVTRFFGTGGGQNGSLPEDVEVLNGTVLMNLSTTEDPLVGQVKEEEGKCKLFLRLCREICYL